MMSKILTVMLCATLGAQATKLPQPKSAPKGFDLFNETTEQYDERAKWLRDGKFGVFLHFNPAVNCGGEVSWIMKQDMGDMPRVSPEVYNKLPEIFNPKKFDAKEWVKLFEEAGFRYSVIVPKHHDGYVMWNTKVPGKNVMQTPFGRDYIKEIAEAFHGSKVRFGLYYSILDWSNKKYSGAPGADLTAYKNEVFKPHMKELLSNYGDVACIWFDGHWDGSWKHKDAKEMYAYIRQLQPKTLMGNRIDEKASNSKECAWTGSFWHGPDPVGDYQAREMNVGEFYMDKAWDNCYNLRANPCGSWSWIKDKYNWPVRSRNDVLGKLIDCIGRDGGLLLGVGPREDGTIDKEDAFALRNIGLWLEEYGEAVYGTRGGPWMPGPWGVSTRKENKVYVFVKKMNNGQVTLPALQAKVLFARMLQGAPIKCEQKDGYLNLSIPRGRRNIEPAAIVELTIDRNALELPAILSSTISSLAVGKPVTVSSVWTGRDKTDLKPAFITDGNVKTLWAAEESSREATATVDLGKIHSINKISFSDAPYRRTRDYLIQVFVGNSWKTVGEGTETNFSGTAEVELDGIEASKVRVIIRKASDTPVISEIQVFGK